MPNNAETRRRRRATLAKSYVLTFHVVDEKTVSGLKRVDELIPDEFKQNWFVGRASIEKDYYFFEQPGVGIPGRAGQNLISEKGIQDINNELAEISNYSLIVEDANGVPVPQPPKDRPVEYIFADISNLQPLAELRSDKSTLFKKSKIKDEDAIMPMVYEEDEVAQLSPALSRSSINHGSRKESADYFSEAPTPRTPIFPSFAGFNRSRTASQDSFWALSRRTPQSTRISGAVTSPKDEDLVKEESKDGGQVEGSLELVKDVSENEINVISRNVSFRPDSPCLLEDSLFGDVQHPESIEEDSKPSSSPVCSPEKSKLIPAVQEEECQESPNEMDICENNENSMIPKDDDIHRSPSQVDFYENDENVIPGDDESLRSDTTCASNVSRSSYVVRVIDGQQAFFLKGFRGEDSDLAKLCFVCKQSTIQGWNSLFLKLSTEKIVKLGEGAFGEVYRGIFEGEIVALKIFPFKENPDSMKNYPEINGNIMMPADEVRNEVVLTQEVSKLHNNETGMTPNFIGLRRTFVLRGKYPDEFTKAWENYDKKKQSENDHPLQYSSTSRHYIAMALELGGSDLEHFQIKGEKQVLSIFLQVALSLAIAEDSLEFEHRDLHWGNILVKKITTKNPLEYYYKGKKVKIIHQGLSVKIIDFTLSRICKENTIIYRNLEDDPFLFEQEVTDMQFQVYKDMRTLTQGRWHEFWPGTNCLWLEYLADKLLYGVKGINVPTGITKDKKERLMKTLRLVREYNSVGSFINDCEEFSRLVSNYWKSEDV